MRSTPPRQSSAPSRRHEHKGNANAGQTEIHRHVSDTGRTLSGDHEFQKGFGAITGPNEAGKSVILEMIRFSLFGTAALRGKSDDYKNLKVELEFTVRGETYRTKRTITTAKLFRGDEEIANGVKGTNAKVVEILGFGLDVFDTACVANQGDIEKLGAMKPTERKQMVNSVIGLSVIDEIAKWCGEEARSIASAVSGMEEGLVKPEKPEGEHRPSSEISAELEPLRAQRDELLELKGWLSHTREKPEDPGEAPTLLTAEEVEEELEQARRYEEAQKELARLPEPPTVDPDTVQHRRLGAPGADPAQLPRHHVGRGDRQGRCRPRAGQEVRAPRPLWRSNART